MYVLIIINIRVRAIQNVTDRHPHTRIREQANGFDLTLAHNRCVRQETPHNDTEIMENKTVLC